MNPSRIYLVRHGETDWNAEGRLLSFTDDPLNAHGESQAVALGDALADVRWERAISSPLLRARRTADLILAVRGDSPALEIDARLSEVDFGPYEGWTSEQLEADPVAVRRRRDGAEIPGVETDEGVLNEPGPSWPRSMRRAGRLSSWDTDGCCASSWPRRSACRRPSLVRCGC